VQSNSLDCLHIAANSRDGGQDRIELATFYIGDKWLGINAGKVREAINSDGITSIPGARECVIGKLLHNNKVLTIIDIRTQLRLPEENFDPGAPIVVVETENGEWIGLVVDALGEIPQVGMDRVDSSRNAFDAQESYVECIIKPLVQSGQKDLLVVLDPTRLVKTLIGKRH
jgi:chemotaxis signal transduction protein